MIILVVAKLILSFLGYTFAATSGITAKRMEDSQKVGAKAGAATVTTAALTTLIGVFCILLAAFI